MDWSEVCWSKLPDPVDGKFAFKFRSDWVSFSLATEFGVWREERSWNWLELNNSPQSETGRHKIGCYTSDTGL